MLRRLITPDEADELREAGDGIAMAAEGVVVMVDHLIDRANRIAPEPVAKPYYCGGTTLIGQSQ